MSEDEILEDYPELEREDFRAVYEYAASLGKRVPLSMGGPILCVSASLRRSDLRRFL